MATVKENLIAAKALISDPARWVKETWSDDGCFCTLGAVAVVVGCGFLEVGQRDRVAETRALTRALPDPFRSVVGFNDAGGTTHADIMALFERAISSQSPSDLGTLDKGGV